MIKGWVLVLGILFITNVNSQSIILKGYIKDQNNLQVLEYANIIAKEKNTEKNTAFTITDEKGFYKLTLKKTKSILLKLPL